MKKFLVFASLLVLTLLLTLTPTFVYANDFMDNYDVDEFGYYDYYLINAPDVVKYTNSNDMYIGVVDCSKSFLRENDNDVLTYISDTRFYTEDGDYINTSLEIIPSVSEDVYDELTYIAYCSLHAHSQPNVLIFEYNNVVLTTNQLDSLQFTRVGGGSFTFSVDVKFKFLNDFNSLETYDLTSSGTGNSLQFNSSELEEDIVQNDLVYIEQMSIRIESNNIRISGLDLIGYEDRNINIDSWEQAIIDQFNQMSDFSVGDWLLDNVDSFLSFELFPGFTLANLLWFVVLVPLLIFLLKMFLGG